MDWLAKAADLGVLISKTRLHQSVVSILDESGTAVGVACSGGLDSLAGLLLMVAHFPRLRDRLTVLHFNHCVRAADADKDQQFVGEVSEALGLPFFSDQWVRSPDEKVSESSLRKARLKFFDKFVRKKNRAIIVTGHQQDDILETLMLRIARSSNLEGLSAPRPVTIFGKVKIFVRPLLELKKEELHSAMHQLDIPWREDASNEGSDYDRNRLRNEVIPKWKTSTQFDLGKAAAKVSEYLSEADGAVRHLMDFYEYPSPAESSVCLPDSVGPKAILRKFFTQWIAKNGHSGSMKPSLVNDILGSIEVEEDGKWSVGNQFLVLVGRRLSFVSCNQSEEVPWKDSITLQEGGETILSNGNSLSMRIVEPFPSLLEDLGAGKYSEDSTVLIDRDHLKSDSIQVRKWLPGDRYKPLSGPGSRKLQDMFVDRKISHKERNTLPVVENGDSVVIWCPGLPVNHNYRVTSETKEILQLTYKILH